MVVGKVGAFFLNVWGLRFHRHRHGVWSDRGFGGLGFWRAFQRLMWGVGRFWGRTLNGRFEVVQNRALF